MFSICGMITRQQAVDLYGSAESLAAALGYKSRHAIYMWGGADEPIPELPFLKLRYELRPDAFSEAGEYIGPAPEKGEAA